MVDAPNRKKSFKEKIEEINAEKPLSKLEAFQLEQKQELIYLMEKLCRRMLL